MIERLRQAAQIEACPACRVNVGALRCADILGMKSPARDTECLPAPAIHAIEVTRVFITDGVSSQGEGPRERLCRSRGDGIGDNVDQAADGTGTIQNTRRSPDDIDLYNAQGLYGCGMCGVLRRNVPVAETVFQNEDTIIRESSQYGSGRSGTIAPDSDAGKVRDLLCIA